MSGFYSVTKWVMPRHLLSRRDASVGTRMRSRVGGGEGARECVCVRNIPGIRTASNDLGDSNERPLPERSL